MSYAIYVVFCRACCFSCNSLVYIGCNSILLCSVLIAPFVLLLSCVVLYVSQFAYHGTSLVLASVLQLCMCLVGSVCIAFVFCRWNMYCQSVSIYCVTHVSIILCCICLHSLAYSVVLYALSQCT